ncbi:siphovirus Gp157 family protein [Sulfurovum sp. CS9]|uniref:siphovirus Gp157 family protein n=1 Tax=Sulfurovum sp. CS9 TaxID=3391146 RepID=UPI0039ECBBFF
MKTTRYRFEETVQSATAKTKEWLKEELRAILESDKDYTRKADYIGFSVLSIDKRIESIEEEIKELQELKKSLKTAKELVLTTGAEVFTEYGIDKLDGAGISSITFTGATTSDKTKLIIEDREALIEAGFYKKVLDEEMLRDLYHTSQYKDIIQSYTRLDVTSTPKPAKIKINKRRGVNNPTHTITEEVA